MKNVTVKVLSGLGLSVLLASAWAEPVQNASASITQQQISSRVNAVSNVEMRFNRGANNAAVMNFSIPAKHSAPKIERLRNDLILTFPDLALAANAQRSYDVSEFSTPVRNVSLQRLGNDTKITISGSSAAWDYSVKDNGSQYVVTMSDQGALFNALDDRPKPKSFKGGRITLDFQDVDVRTILQIIAKESGQNIVASDSVQGKMTLNLKDVPWDQALDLVMQARDLDMRKHGNVINIAPRRELLNQEREQMRGNRELAELGVLLSRSFQLKYKSVEEFKTMLESSTRGGNSGSSSGSTNTMLTSRGSAMFDASTNTMVVTDTQDVITKFEKLVAQLDVPVRQVMIEARIVEASDTFHRELGVKWQASSLGYGSHAHTGIGGGHSLKGYNTDGKTLSWGPEYKSDGVDRFGNDTVSINYGQPNVSLPASAATSAVTLFRQTAHSFLGLELSAMQDNGKGKIISSPRVLTQDRKEASLQAGQEIPYETSTSSGATAIQWKDATTGIKVTPQITPDGNVIMTVKISKNSVSSYYNAGVPILNKKEVETSAMVENGGTMVVGGLYEEDNTNDASKVPLLGDIPVLGNLFKHTTKVKNRRELLIFITPRIVDTMNTSNLNY